MSNTNDVSDNNDDSTSANWSAYLQDFDNRNDDDNDGLGTPATMIGNTRHYMETVPLNDDDEEEDVIIFGGNNNDDEESSSHFFGNDYYESQRGEDPLAAAGAAIIATSSSSSTAEKADHHDDDNDIESSSSCKKMVMATDPNTTSSSTSEGHGAVVEAGASSSSTTTNNNSNSSMKACGICAGASVATILCIICLCCIVPLLIILLIWFFMWRAANDIMDNIMVVTTPPAAPLELLDNLPHEIPFLIRTEQGCLKTADESNEITILQYDCSNYPFEAQFFYNQQTKQLKVASGGQQQQQRRRMMMKEITFLCVTAVTTTQYNNSSSSNSSEKPQDGEYYHATLLPCSNEVDENQKFHISQGIRNPSLFDGQNSYNLFVNLPARHDMIGNVIESYCWDNHFPIDHQYGNIIYPAINPGYFKGCNTTTGITTNSFSVARRYIFEIVPEQYRIQIPLSTDDDHEEESSSTTTTTVAPVTVTTTEEQEQEDEDEEEDVLLETKEIPHGIPIVIKTESASDGGGGGCLTIDTVGSYDFTVEECHYGEMQRFMYNTTTHTFVNKLQSSYFWQPSDYCLQDYATSGSGLTRNQFPIFFDDCNATEPRQKFQWDLEGRLFTYYSKDSPAQYYNENHPNNHDYNYLHPTGKFCIEVNQKKAAEGGNSNTTTPNNNNNQWDINMEKCTNDDNQKFYFEEVPAKYLPRNVALRGRVQQRSYDVCITVESNLGTGSSDSSGNDPPKVSVANCSRDQLLWGNQTFRYYPGMQRLEHLMFGDNCLEADFFGKTISLDGCLPVNFHDTAASGRQTWSFVDNNENKNATTNAPYPQVEVMVDDTLPIHCLVYDTKHHYAKLEPCDSGEVEEELRIGTMIRFEFWEEEDFNNNGSDNTEESLLEPEEANDDANATQLEGSSDGIAAPTQAPTAPGGSSLNGTSTFTQAPTSGSGTGSVDRATPNPGTQAPTTGSGTGSVDRRTPTPSTQAPTTGSGTGSVDRTTPTPSTQAPTTGSGTGSVDRTTPTPSTQAPTTGSGTGNVDRTPIPTEAPTLADGNPNSDATEAPT